MHPFAIASFIKHIYSIWTLKQILKQNYCIKVVYMHERAYKMYAQFKMCSFRRVHIFIYTICSSSNNNNINIVAAAYDSVSISSFLVCLSVCFHVYACNAILAVEIEILANFGVERFHSVMVLLWFFSTFLFHGHMCGCCMHTIWCTIWAKIENIFCMCTLCSSYK